VNRPYQQEAIDAICQSMLLGDVRQSLLVCPTGGGKTHIFAQLPPLFGSPVLIMAHRLELLDQAAAKLRSANPDLRVDIEQGALRAHPDADVVIASVQTFVSEKRRARFRQKFSLVIVDEAHRCAEEGSYDKILTDLGCFDGTGPALLGCTATPFRSDGKSLGKFFKTVVHETRLLDLIDQGFLVPIRAYSAKTTTSLAGVGSRAGDFIESELSDAINTDKRNVEIVRAWKELAAGRRSTLVFCADKAHATNLNAAFRAADVGSEVVFGDTQKDERRERFARFVAGAFPVLLGVGVFTEGTDLPPVDTILLARPSKSRVFVTQAIGRGARLSPATGKTDAVVIDMMDATAGHNLATAASLFDLPATVNAKGADLRRVRDKVKAFAEEFPGMDLSGQGEITEEWIDAKRRQIAEYMKRSSTSVQASEVNLFGARVDPEARKATKLAWFRNFDGALRLNLPADEGGRRAWASVKADAAGTYWLEMPERNHGPYPTEAEALKVAEWEVSSSYGDQLGLIKSKATWHSKPVSEKQAALIKKLGGAVPEKMTAGQAKETIDALLSQREATWDGPCTPAQAWALRRQGYDVRDLTKREAGRLLASLKRA
jgi:superfamily II DNA or RNA helicase